MASESFTVTAPEAGATLAAGLRKRLPDFSWTRIRQLIAARRVRIGGELCLDPARRLRDAETVEVLPRSALASPAHEPVVIRYLDRHLVVVEKPAGISTVRHPAERFWSRRRKALQPTLEDIVPRLIAKQEGRQRKGVLPRLRVVQRLDKETSGLVVFARTVAAERGLGLQFRAHTVTRRYVAIVRGYLPSQRIATRLIRDRGDGRRGSTTIPGMGKEAVTHVEVLERLSGYTLLSCRLETGRTHQIRIHLAELGHPICGERVYNRAVGEPAKAASMAAPRLALHAAELGFEHPITGNRLSWSMALPKDLAEFLDISQTCHHRESGHARRP
jgi:23S rRNA pseudouridine1911/1915/1917 synthase